MPTVSRTPLDPTASHPGCNFPLGGGHCGNVAVVMDTDENGVNLFYCAVHVPDLEEPTPVEEEVLPDGEEEAADAPADPAAPAVEGTPV